MKAIIELPHKSVVPRFVARPLFRVLLARHHGMCFGVNDAIEEVTRLARDGPVTILGQLVHNGAVREKLVAMGAEEGKLEDDDASTGRVVITAHGASDRVRKRWQSTGHTVVDTTCPLVRRAHQALAQLVEDGCYPVVIGKKGHVEVNGLTGDFPGCMVIESPADLKDVPEAKRFGVVSQTTQPLARVLALVEALRRVKPESRVEFRDTVCRPTKDRQAALEDLCKEATLIVVVGGANSNNTKELLESARAMGVKAWRVERPGEIDTLWFIGHKVVGVTAGTSTLPETVEAVVSELRRLAHQVPAVSA